MHIITAVKSNKQLQEGLISWIPRTGISFYKWENECNDHLANRMESIFS